MSRSWILLLLLAVAACDLADSTQPRLENSSAVSPGVRAYGTTVDVEWVGGPPEDGLLADTAAIRPFKVAIADIAFVPNPDTAAITREFRKWFNQLVLPRLAVAQDDFILFLALSEFYTWQVHAEAIYANVDASFRAELTRFDNMLATKLRPAIDANLAVCRSQRSIEALANVLLWFRQADDLGLLNEPTVNYSEAALRSDIRSGCAEVVLTQASLQPLMDVGSFYPLRLSFELQLGTPGVLTDQKFEVDAASGEANVEQGGFTDDQGTIDLTVRPNVPGTIEIPSQACLVLPGRTTSTPHVCGVATIVRQAQVPPVTPPQPPPPPPSPTTCGGTFTPAVPGGVVQVFNNTSLNAVASFTVIDGSLHVANNDSLINVNFPCLQKVTGGVSVGANRHMLEISFPQLREVGLSLSMNVNPLLTSASFPLLQVIGNNLSRPGGALGISNNPALSNLVIGPVTITRSAGSILGGMQIMQPLSLTNLSGISTAIAVDTLFFTLPPAGQPGLTKTDFQNYKATAPLVRAVCELPFGVSGARVCL